MNASPSGLEAHLGYWLRMVSNSVFQGFARRLEAEGVTVAEWVFLRSLYDAERMAPSTLAGVMGMTRGAISRLAERLLEKSLVEREANAEDGRAHTLALSAEGRALVPRLAVLADTNDAEFFGSLDPGERATLAGLLKKIIENRGVTGIPVD